MLSIRSIKPLPENRNFPNALRKFCHQAKLERAAIALCHSNCVLCCPTNSVKSFNLTFSRPQVCPILVDARSADIHAGEESVVILRLPHSVNEQFDDFRVFHRIKNFA